MNKTFSIIVLTLILFVTTTFLHVILFSSEKLLEVAVNNKEFKELCVAHSYSVRLSSKAEETIGHIKVNDRVISTPHLRFKFADDTQWVIVGIQENKENQVFIVDKNTVLKYFNDTDKNQCKSIKL